MAIEICCTSKLKLNGIVCISQYKCSMWASDMVSLPMIYSAPPIHQVLGILPPKDQHGTDCEGRLIACHLKRMD